MPHRYQACLERTQSAGGQSSGDQGAGNQSAGGLLRLPRLQELFYCCDAERLACCVIQHFAGLNFLTKTSWRTQRKVIEKRITATLTTLCMLPVEKCLEVPFVLIPEFVFVPSWSSPGNFSCLLCAAPVHISQAPHAQAVCNLCAPASVYAQVKQNRTALRQKGLFSVFERHRFALIPWEEVLAYRVWFGEHANRREKYEVLASAFWELTWFGFDYDGVCAARAQKQAGVEEQEEKGRKKSPAAHLDALGHSALGYDALGHGALRLDALEHGTLKLDALGHQSGLVQGKGSHADRKRLHQKEAILSHNAHLTRCQMHIELVRHLGLL